LGGSLLLHQLTPQAGVGCGAPVRVKNRERKGQNKENSGQPRGELHQNVGGLRTEDVFSDRTAECRSQSLAFWPLH
jgi:hypothetical protein